MRLRRHRPHAERDAAARAELDRLASVAAASAPPRSEAEQLDDVREKLDAALLVAHKTGDLRAVVAISNAITKALAERSKREAETEAAGGEGGGRVLIVLPDNFRDGPPRGLDIAPEDYERLRKISEMSQRPLADDGYDAAGFRRPSSDTPADPDDTGDGNGYS
jgi:hypothetical protein